jgi:hypothetical protein
MPRTVLIVDEAQNMAPDTLEELRMLSNVNADKDQVLQLILVGQAELREALSRVKILNGLLPICSSCKKIRDDQGYWNQMELYIHEHSEAGAQHRFGGLVSLCAKYCFMYVHNFSVSRFHRNDSNWH